MGRDPEFARLLTKSLAALVISAALVALCYAFVDRPVAFWVHDNGINAHDVLKWLTYPPPLVQEWAPLLLAALAARRAWGPWSRAETVLFAACVGIIVADQFEESVRVLFGRYWPDTWIHNNPSLIRNGAYGFDPFHGANGGSFPSGHTTRTAAFVAPVWVAWPRWRWVCVVAVGAVVVGLVGMNYHFVGDTVGGATLGALVGAYAALLSGITTLNSAEEER